MKKSVIFILLFIIFANFNKVYANGIAASNEVDGIAIKKRKKITLESFYDEEINETNIKEYINEIRNNFKMIKRMNGFLKKMTNILEDLYNEEQNKEL